jgi:hypothetical protein
LTPRCELPTFKIYWDRTGNRNTRQSLQMPCERRAYLNSGRLERADAQTCRPMISIAPREGDALM